MRIICVGFVYIYHEGKSERERPSLLMFVDVLYTHVIPATYAHIYKKYINAVFVACFDYISKECWFLVSKQRL